MLGDTFQALVARVNANAHIPGPDPTGVQHMAKQVKMAKGKEFTFAKGKVASKYPWSEWLNGDLLMLEQSEGGKDNKGTVISVNKKKDFEVDPQAMRGKIKFAGRKQYKHVDISFRDADGNKLEGAVIIRARDMTADERQAEDELRAVEKQEAQERRAEERAKRATAAAQPAANGAATAPTPKVVA